MLPGGHLEQSGRYCNQLISMLLPATLVPRELEKGPSGVWQLLPQTLDLSLLAQSPKQPTLSPASCWSSLPAP